MLPLLHRMPYFHGHTHVNVESTVCRFCLYLTRQNVHLHVVNQKEPFDLSAVFMFSCRKRKVGTETAL